MDCRLKKPKPPKCPNCKKPLLKVEVNSNETYIWTVEGSVGFYKNDAGDAEENCSECGHKYPCENDETGDVSCVDVIVDASKGESEERK
jgi:hypothetical protein